MTTFTNNNLDTTTDSHSAQFNPMFKTLSQKKTTSSSSSNGCLNASANPNVHALKSELDEAQIRALEEHEISQGFV